MSEENIEVSRRLVSEAFGEGKVELIDEHVAESFVGHDPLLGDEDREASKQSIVNYRAAFPDLSFTVDDAFAADDKVVIRWTAQGTFENALMGIEPTGERGDPVSGITIDRYEDGELVESWTHWDALLFMRNLGVVGDAAATA
jgi:predicted ester cyclase